MAPIHAWDCSCGQRSAPTAAFCQHCGAPRSSGVAVPQVSPPPGVEIPRPRPLGFIVLFCVLLIIVGYLLRPGETVGLLIPVIAALALVPWWLWIGLIVVSLLLRIASALERIGH